MLNNREEFYKKYRLTLKSKPNNSGISISKSEVLNWLEFFAQQINDLEFLYYLSGYLNDALASRENGDFSYRWYAFALNSMTAQMEIICAKLLSYFKKDCSFYNLLRIICEERHYGDYIKPEDEGVFDAIIKDFNESFLPIYYQIFERRNKAGVHNDKMFIFDKEQSKRIREMTTELYEKALSFLSNGVNKLYRVYARKDILFPNSPKITICECEREIKKFVSILSDEGLLRVLG